MNEGFIPIHLVEIMPDQTFDFDIFLYLPNNSKYIKYINSNDTISEKKLNRLEIRRVDSLYINGHEVEKYRKFVSSSIKRRLDNCDESKKSDLIREEAKRLILTIDKMSDDSDILVWNNNCIELTRLLIDELTDARIGDVFNKLKALLSRSPTIVNHSISTCCLSALIAMLNGIYSPSKLVEITFGALLHDVGLSRLPEGITEKFLSMKDFSEKEFDEYSRHPQEGVKILGKFLKSKFIAANVKRIVGEHHENESGTGFPKGISGCEILYATKLVAVGDRLALEIINTDSSHLKWIVSNILSAQKEEKALNVDILKQIVDNL